MTGSVWINIECRASYEVAGRKDEPLEELHSRLATKYGITKPLVLKTATGFVPAVILNSSVNDEF